MRDEPKAKRPLIATHAVVSLWDLMQTARCDELLEHARRALILAKRAASHPGPPEAGALGSELVSECRAILGHCGELGLHAPMRQARDFIEALEGNGPREAPTGVDRAIELVNSLEAELKFRRFLVLEPGQADRCLGDESFGAAVDAAFPTAAPEIAEAGKCLAVGRFDAAVFHLMRALEVGLRCLTDRLSASFAHAGGEVTLEQIEAMTGQMSTGSHGPEWRALRRFYSETAAYFHVLSGDWTSYSLHLNERYDARRAMNVHGSVRAFLQHLSTRLAER